jgi:hypothetical protein
VARPTPEERFRLARQVTLFVLGVVVIVDGIAGSTKPVAEIVAGLVLVGLVPVDDLLSRLPTYRRRARPERDL